ncbi:MAG TPA: hypothetical protein PKH37_07225 [Alphaproteobacteria bacterium]|nr:hypothetical protein [Alphaproteobacteria bacterium]
MAPLTKQLREQSRAEVGGSDGDSDDAKKSVTRQQTTARTTTTAATGTESRNLSLQSGTSNQNQPSANSPRGSLIDITV